MKYFVADSTAGTASRTGRCSSQYSCSFFHKLRTAIAEKQQERAAQFAGERELDESYSGGIRRGKRGRGGNPPFFGVI